MIMRRALSIIICFSFTVLTMAQNDFTKNIEAAKNGDPKAQYIIGCCYADGDGIEKDESQAVFWWRKSAEQGQEFSQHNLGVHYRLGIGIEQDYKQALYWLRQAANQGSSASQYEIGSLYEEGLGVEKDMSEAFTWYKKAADQGLDVAQFAIGYMYDTGDGIEEDKKQAINWYMKAATQGEARAQNNLGELYLWGDGVNIDYIKAINWFRKSATKNNSDAQCNIGKMYYNGKGVKKDYAKAAEWYKRAADQGNAYAETLLGFMYEDGKGVIKDYSKAVELYKRSAEKGYDEGQRSLAHMYFQGRGVVENLAKVAEWYYKAASQGNSNSQNMLAKMYYYGWGVDQNYKEAIKWNKLAAAQGDEDAEKEISEWRLKIPKEFIDSEEKFQPSLVHNTQNDFKTEPSPQISAPKSGKTEGLLCISDVDEDMPLNTVTNRKTFAIIIGNENYKNEVKVPYAEKDAMIFKEYVNKTLGVPYEQIKHIENATYNDLRMATNWIIQAMKVCRGKGKAIIYYAGHGIPNETDYSSYLLPVDGIGNDPGSAFSLTDLYKKLGEVEALSITVFLDACFSGSKREEGMLTSARGVAIKSRQGLPQGNMIVFSAAQGDETAYPYKDMQHGLFTYFLLKKLKETKGEVTLGELSEYLADEVGRQSFLKNNKIQTPTVSVAPSLQNSWKSLKLK